jgi:hypothetical protein
LATSEEIKKFKNLVMFWLFTYSNLLTKYDEHFQKKFFLEIWCNIMLLFFHNNLLYESHWISICCTLKLLERLKCEFKNENNDKSWGVFFNLQRFESKGGVLKLQDGD